MPALDLAQVRDAPLRAQPGMLLRLLLEKLGHAGLLQVTAALTHREIGRRAGGQLADAGLDRLCTAAERVAYDHWQPAPGDVAALHEAYLRLCDAIDTRAATLSRAGEEQEIQPA